MANNVFAVAAIAMGGLTACGGGGGGASAPAPAPAPAPVVEPAPAPVPTPAPTSLRPADWKLAWSDEFERDGLPDPAKWAYDTDRNKLGWYNEEEQYYAQGRLENSRVENGKLIIQARREALVSAADYGGQQYTSARLVTRGKQDWTYGFVEVRAKLPCGLGTWPAIWMLGSRGAWPDDGEIDIMEHVGKKKGEILGTVHTRAYNHTAGTHKGGATQLPDACDAFHRYQLHWSATQIVVGVDDKAFFTFANPGDGDRAKWPFDAPQYLILNLALGGMLGGPIDDAIFPVQMEVDYVRVYQP